MPRSRPGLRASTLALAALLLLAGAAEAAPSGKTKEDRKDADAKVTAHEKREKTPKAGAEREDPEDERPRERKPAVGSGFRTTPDSSDLEGDHVAFTYTPDAIRRYTVGGIPYFDAAISGSAPGSGGSPRTEAAEIRLDTAAYKARAHDDRTGALTIETRGEITLTFPEGAILKTRGKGIDVTLPEGARAYVWGGNAALDGTTVTTEKTLHFRTRAPTEAGAASRDKLEEAAATRQLGAEVRLSRAEGEIRRTVVTYANLTVETLLGERAVTLILDGHGREGRIISVDLDPAVVGAGAPEELVLSFDNGTIARATDLADILDPDDDGLNPEYYLVQDVEGYHLIVSVPHYSVHTLTIAGIEIPPSVVVGALAGVVLVASGGWVLFRRPGRR